jgi:lysine/ornithine N-monooxygenase/predicted FMN-binding regulatory protein PaiB
VAQAFSDQVRYGTVVRKVTPVALEGETTHSVFRVEVQSVDTKESAVYFARNVVYASGGKPRVPEERVSLTRRIIHSSEFLHRFPSSFAEHADTYEFGVVGDGQSAGEIVAELLHRYPRALVHLFISGYAPRPVDNSPFVNEAFFSQEAEVFYLSSEAKRKAMRHDLRNTNYGVIDPELIKEIYRCAYLDEVKGERRLFVHRFSKLVSAEENGNGVKVMVQEHCGGDSQALRCDGLVLATGYKRCLDETIFKDVLPFVEKNESGDILLSRNYHVRTTVEMNCRLYVQGYGESSHGLGDTLLSLLPFRSKEIFDDICKHAPGVTETTNSQLPASIRLTGDNVEYPPKRHLENEPEKLYAVIERFKFATLISVQPNGEPIVTHVPLTLDRSRGSKGVLFGHMDRANPHVDLLEGRKVLALFHGPNAYISPHVYETNQLPTWNSITVHVRGKAQVMRDKHSLVRGLMGICEQSDQRAGAFRLNPEDPRIERLVDFIVGFEIEIDELIGRFKLSQDRTVADARRAAMELARRSEAGERHVIEAVLGYRL